MNEFKFKKLVVEQTDHDNAYRLTVFMNNGDGISGLRRAYVDFIINLDSPSNVAKQLRLLADGIDALNNEKD